MYTYIYIYIYIRISPSLYIYIYTQIIIIIIVIIIIFASQDFDIFPNPAILAETILCRCKVAKSIAEMCGDGKSTKKTALTTINITILAIFYPPLKSIWGCVWLFLQAQEGNIYFTELAERVEYGNYDYGS